MNFCRILFISCFLTTYFGCAPYKPSPVVEPPSVMPPTFSETGEASVPDRWWTALGDETLDDLIERGISGNLDLKGAWARWRQFDAIALRSNRAANVAINGSASRGRSHFSGQAATANSFGLTSGISYEVDLWKRLSFLDKAESWSASASRQDLEAVAFSLSGLIARTWYAMVAQRALLALFAEQVNTSREFLDVIEARFANGAASAVEVFQQREQLASIRAQIPPVEASLAVLSNQLAVLLGRPPRETVAAPLERFPDLPPLPEPGAPMDLLQNRPDLRGAAHRILAADHRVAAAVAARYPSLRLGGDTGYNAVRISDLFSNWIWSLVASVTGPILDGKARKAEVVRTSAVLEEAVYSYEHILLTAVREVEDAYILEKRQHELIERLETQLSLAQSALDAGQNRFLQGVGDFLTVLTEIQAVQRVERSIISAKSELVSIRIGLYQALGGPWTADLEPPVLSVTQGAH